MGKLRISPDTGLKFDNVPGIAVGWTEADTPSSDEEEYAWASVNWWKEVFKGICGIEKRLCLEELNGLGITVAGIQTSFFSCDYTTKPSLTCGPVLKHLTHGMQKLEDGRWSEAVFLTSCFEQRVVDHN
eukprot:symbB.v1.2.026795.t2/scaffold2707.1/size72648/3